MHRARIAAKMLMRTTTDKDRRSEHHSARIAAGLAIAALIGFACVAMFALETSNIVNRRSEILADGRKDTANLAGSLIQHAELTFRVADALLIGAVERLEHDGTGLEARQRLKSWFEQEATRSTQFSGFAVIDSSGAMIASASGDSASTDVSDRAYFIYHQKHPDRELRIGAPVRRRASQDWLIPVTRRFDRTDGSFGGVVIAAINPRYFQDFYDRLQLGEDGAVLLASLDGPLLVRRPFTEANIGRDMRESGIFRQLKQAPVGSIEITAATDGIIRLNSYERGHSYPLVLAVARNLDELLAPWRHAAIVRLGETTALALLISMLGYLIWRTMASLAASAVRLRETNIRFDAAVNRMSTGLCLYDRDKRIVIANQRYAQIHRLSAEQICPGTHFDDVVTYRHQNGTGFKAPDDLFSATQQEDITEVHDLPDGRIVSIARHTMPDGGLLAIHEDITVRANNERRIAYVAGHDQLTGLANRHQFSEFLEQVSGKHRRASDQFALLMLDLDKFKEVNDRLGHAAGDILLSTVARRLKDCTRDTDLVARLGGDEFAIIQRLDDQRKDAAIALARRVIDAVCQPIDLDGLTVNVGTSIGIALKPEHGALSAELMRKADLALYAAKAAGRNDYRIYDDQIAAAGSEMRTIEQDLRDALQRQEFELHFQPIMELGTGVIRAAEALVRWRHPKRGLLLPDQFIPLAESAGLIVPLGAWIVRTACHEAAAWQRPIRVAVNISEIQLLKGNLFDVVLTALLQSGLPAARLELELKEKPLLDQERSHAQMLRQLGHAGITVVIDGLGAGYLSAGHLGNFSFGRIKIAKSLVHGVTNRRECVAVISSILTLARELGVETTAEGIETAEQMQFLRDAGVTYGQGVYVGRPARDLAMEAPARVHRQTA
jgi:diguanylate cyclase (GGDEF)-like protein